jgi:hypothetical protein
VTSSTTQSPATESSAPKTIEQPEPSRDDDDGGMMAQFAGNQATDRSSDVITEKEGRAINFPLEILSNNQNSTEPGHMHMAAAKGGSSTDVPHVMSFFDLSDVSMDRETDDDDKASDEYSNAKKDKKQQFASKDKIDGSGDKKNECPYNGTNYKVSAVTV